MLFEWNAENHLILHYTEKTHFYAYFSRLLNLRILRYFLSLILGLLYAYISTHLMQGYGNQETAFPGGKDAETLPDTANYGKNYYRRKIPLASTTDRLISRKWCNQADSTKTVLTEIFSVENRYLTENY